MEDTESQMSILIIDDTPANLRLLAQMLGDKGYRVRPVTSGAQALLSAQTTPPDLILLDVMMPDEDGFGVAGRLKADERTREIPIVFISALDDIDSKIRAFASGGVDYITKPFHSAEVLARVESHLALRRLQGQLRAQNVELRRYAERLKTMNEVDQSILAARSPQIVAVAVIGRIRQLVPCQRVTILAFSESGRAEILAAESSGSLALRTDTTIYAEMFRGRVGERMGQVQGVEDLSALSDLSPSQQRLYTEGVRSYVVVPMSAHDEMVGALHLEADQPHAFTAGDINVAIEIAILMALAIRQTRLYEQAQRELAARKQVEAALHQYTRELEASNAELDAFAHTVAHDLRSPLTSLIGFSSLLRKRRERLSDEQISHGLDMIERSSQKMASIINELLLLASVRKIEDVAVGPLEMAGVVAEVQQRLSDMVAEHQADLILPAVENWPGVLGYGPWIEEVWVNYVSNALKYGGQPPRVELGWDDEPVSRSTADSHVRFWVRDNGPGLTLEEQARLFTPFTRLNQVRVEGHGLGLSIVQRIVEKLGGRVGVESAPGQGSTFYFTLPMGE